MFSELMIRSFEKWNGCDAAVYSSISRAEFDSILVLVWGMITGYVFSTVGAAGAILTFVGQVVVFKLGKFMLKHLPTMGYSEAQAHIKTAVPLFSSIY